MQVHTVEEFLSVYKKNVYNLLQLSGDDFEVSEVIFAIKKEFKEDRIEVFFKGDAEDALHNLSAKTLFGDKLMIIYEVDTFPKSQYNKVKKITKNPERLKPNTIILTYSNKKIMPRVQNSLSCSFETVYDSGIPSWIKRFIRGKGYSITEEAINLLHFSFGTNRKELKKQIELIVGRLKNTNREITIEDVKEIGYCRDDTIFKITNSMIEGKYKTALQYLMEFSDNKSLFYFINRDLRYLLIVKANLDAGESIKKLSSKERLNLNNYFLYNKYKVAAEKVSYKKMEQQYEDIIDAEYKIKNGWNEFSVNFNLISQLQVGGK